MSASSRIVTASGLIYLLSIDDVHDNATLQHAGESCLNGEVVLAVLRTVAICGGEFSCHRKCVAKGIRVLAVQLKSCRR